MKWLLSALILTSSASAFADVPHPRTYYRFDFTVSELDRNKRLEVHAYSLILADNMPGEVHVGTNRPIDSTVQSSRVDVGTTIRCTFWVDGDTVVLEDSVEISGDPGKEQSADIHRVTLKGAARLAVGKSTVIASADEGPPGDRRYIVEATATKVN